MPLTRGLIGLAVLGILVSCQPAAAGGLPGQSATFAVATPLLDRLYPRGAESFEQRAIDDLEPEPEPGDGEPRVPDLETDRAASSPSPIKAMLMSAALPGLGELYAGSNRGYLFMGVEGVSWITWSIFRSSSSTKEDEMFRFADRNFAINAFESNCVPQQGQSCAQAVTAIRDFFANDRAEYYEIISKNPIYKAGWGRVQFENGNDNRPEVGTEAYREWIADLSAAQDTDFIAYNQLRDERNDLSRTARSMTVITLLNHLASAWHAYIVAGGLNRPVATPVGEIDMHLDVHPSLSHPGVTFTMKRQF